MDIALDTTLGTFIVEWGYVQMFTFSKKYVYVRQSFTKACSCSVYLNNNAKNLPKNKWNMLYTFTQVKKKKEEISELQKKWQSKRFKNSGHEFFYSI